MEELAYLPYLLVNFENFIYLYQYVLMDIYFILWVIIQHCYLFYCFHCSSFSHEKFCHVVPEPSATSPFFLSTSFLTGPTRCFRLFIAALFTTAKIQKPPKRPWAEEWIKKMWHTYTMEYYSALKKSDILPFAAIWLNFQGIMLSEIRERNTTWYHLNVESRGLHWWSSG